MRELSEAVGVEPKTQRHYFGDRERSLTALMQFDHQLGLSGLTHVSDGPLGPVRQSLRATLEYIRQGFIQGGLADVHVVGFGAGFEAATLGKTYLDELLEPTLQSLEERILRHQREGSLRKRNASHTALSLLGSALVVFLHQYRLGGIQCRPLDVGAFLDDLVDDFLSAHAPAKKQKPKAFR